RPQLGAPIGLTSFLIWYPPFPLVKRAAFREPRPPSAADRPPLSPTVLIRLAHVFLSLPRRRVFVRSFRERRPDLGNRRNSFVSEAGLLQNPVGDSVRNQ